MVQIVTGNLVEVSSALRIEIFNGVNEKILKHILYNNINVKRYKYKMNSFFIFLFIAVLPSISSLLQPNEPKICKNCKFFVKAGILTSDKFGKCLVFPYRGEQDHFLVDGIHEKKIATYHYHYCSTARAYDHLCGEKGKKFEAK
jgi:hypothetical protein